MKADETIIIDGEHLKVRPVMDENNPCTGCFFLKGGSCAAEELKLICWDGDDDFVLMRVEDELKRFTTEELKEELKRRAKAEKLSKSVFMKPEDHWVMFEARVVKVRKGITRDLDDYIVDSEVLANTGWINKGESFSLVRKMFYGKDRPKEGDIVEMRARKYRDGKIRYLDAMITRVLEKGNTE